MKAINKNSEAGITLLLAMFILSGLILIAVTVSALAIQSIRNSRAVVFSEPAIGQAQSGAEEGLWNIKRKTSATVPNCDTNDSSSGVQQTDALGSTSIWSARVYCQQSHDLNLDLSANIPSYIYLYDPADPNGDLDLSGMQDGGYHKIFVTEKSGSRSVNVYLSRIDGTPIGSQPYTIVTGGSTLQIGPPLMQNNSTGDPTAVDNRMVLKLVYCENTCVAGSDKGTVLVDSDIGIPTYPTINSTGCAQRGAATGTQCAGSEIYNRKIDVTVPQ